MIEPRSPSPQPAQPAGHVIGHVVYGLGAGVAMLAWSCIAPLVRAMSWLQQRRDARRRGLGTLFAMPLATAVTAPARTDGACARRGYAVRPMPMADVFEVAPDLDERRTGRLFATLQRSGAKLLDLRPATRITSSLFQQLADSWRAGPDTIPRLAIVLDYERWVVFHTIAERRLRPLVARGVAVEVMYEQQLAHAATWFETGSVVHDISAVLAWLRADWSRAPIWRTVLNTTAMLVHAAAPVEQVPSQLIELMTLALSFDGAEGIEQALVHADSALSSTGKMPSAARCRALRAKATVLRRRGDRTGALAELNTALSVAMVIDDRIEEASTFAEIGRQALRDGHTERAEARFRTALALLSNGQASAPFLRATLHHYLAESLHAQQMYDQAEQHAGAALALRTGLDSPLAGDDRALLDQIRAQRAASAAPSRTPPLTSDKGR